MTQADAALRQLLKSWATSSPTVSSLTLSVYSSKHLIGPAHPRLREPPPQGKPSVVVLSVCDHGPGLDEHQAGELFKPFAKLRSGKSSWGNGLGLWLMSELLSSQGAALGVHSDGPGKGCTFAAAIPALASQISSLEEDIDVFDQAAVMLPAPVDIAGAETSPGVRHSSN